MKYLLLALALSVMGCATTPETIHLDYIPQSNVAALPGADKVNIVIRGRDNRGVGPMVGYKINVDGDNTAQITADNDILGLVMGALNTELRNRGFTFGAGPTEISLELMRFYNKFNTALFAKPSVADVAFSIEIKGPTGALLFKKDIRETQGVWRLKFMGGEYARASLEAALKAAISKVVTDPEFIAALITVPKQGVGPDQLKVESK